MNSFMKKFEAYNHDGTSGNFYSEENEKALEEMRVVYRLLEPKEKKMKAKKLMRAARIHQMGSRTRDQQIIESKQELEKLGYKNADLWK